MKKLNELPLTEKEMELVSASEANYKRHARIFLEILTIDEKKQTVTLRIEQKGLVNDKLLTQKELIERGKKVFANMLDGWKVHVRSLTYKGDLYQGLELEEVKEEINKRNLKQVDLTRYLDIDKHALSKVLNGKHQLTRWQRAAFSYLFKWLDSVA